MSKRAGNPLSRRDKGHLPGGLIPLGRGEKPAGSTAPPSSSGQPVPKKPKFSQQGSSVGSSAGSSPGKSIFSDPVRIPVPGQPSGTPKSSATPPPDVAPSSLVVSVESLLKDGDRPGAIQLVEGAVLSLKESRVKPDTTLNSALATLVSKQPSLFATPSVIEGLVGVLKREQTLVFKLKSNPVPLIVACQLLAVALNKSRNWPESLATAYINDALTTRLWVDLEQCKKLVDNIVTIFHTTTSGSIITPSSSGEGAQAKWDIPVINLEEVSTEPRFTATVESSVRAHALQVLQEQIKKPQHNDVLSRNIVQFLVTGAGWSELRIIATQKVEGWLQNPKLTRSCQDLLSSLSTNIKGDEGADDGKVVELLVSMRLRSKVLANHYLNCVREIVLVHPDHLEIALKAIISNELGPARNSGNMQLIVMLVTAQKDRAAKVIADVFLSLLVKKEDYHRSLRGLFREIVRQMKHNFSYSVFTRQMMQENRDPMFQQLDQPAKERIALVVADLVAFACILMCNLAIRETHNIFVKGDESVGPQLMEFFTTLGGIQRDAMWWAHHILQNMYRLQPAEYKASIRKILFLDPPEAYSAKDNWPPEAERSFIIRLMNEACLLEDTLMRVLVIGLTPELPLMPSDALDIADRLVARAANSHTTVLPKVPTIERLELIEAVLEISMYHAPSSVVLPEEYTPPQLAVSKLYWKGWVLLLVLASFNPHTLGSVVWSDYPTLKGLMEMVMTRTYSFPPTMTLAKDEEGKMQSKEEALQREAEFSQAEKEQILEYEGYLASASKTKITEKNSLMLNQVSLYDPKGPIRRVPSTVVDLIKTVNKSLKLGEILCGCRSPDFLLEIVQQQGTSQCMIWLSELVESSQESIEALPVPCLCEFLLANQNQDKEQDGSEDHPELSGHLDKYKKRKQTPKVKLSERLDQLVERLRDLVVGVSATPQSSWLVLQYFLDKLSSRSIRRQHAALKCLETILVHSSEPPCGLGWFVTSIQHLKHLEKIKNDLCKAFIKACTAVMDVSLSRCLLVSLAAHTTDERALENFEGLSCALEQRLPMLQRAMSSRGSIGGTHSQEVDSQEVVKALLSMMANAVPVAMVIGLQVTEDSPIPDNHIALFQNGDKTGRIVMASLVKFCVQVLSSIDPVKLEDPQRVQSERVISFLFPQTGPVKVIGPNAEVLPMIDGYLRHAILQCPNTSLVQQVLVDCPIMDLVVTTQTFGVPKSTIRLILEKLDQAATDAPDTLQKSIHDREKFLKMLKMQIRRTGTSYGSGALKYLEQTIVHQAHEVKHPVHGVEDMDQSSSPEDMDQGSSPEDMDQGSSPAVGLSQGQKESSHCNFGECLKQFVQRDKGTEIRLLKLLNRRSGENFDTTIMKFLKALRSALGNPQFVRQFCKNPIGLLVLRNLTDISKSHKKHTESLVPILQHIQNFSTKQELTSVSKVAGHCLNVLDCGGGNLENDIRKDFLDKFKKRLEQDPKMKLGSSTCTEELKQAISVNPMDVEDIIRTVSAFARSRHQSLEAASMYRDILLSLNSDASQNIAGLLCDSLQMVIPELVSTQKGLNLLMSLALSSSEGGPIVGGKLFLTQLVHSTCWSSLHQLLATMLSEESSKALDPVASLDFMWACLNRPHLWRCVALKEGVVDPHLSIGVNTCRIWRVSRDEMSVLVEYCLREAQGSVDNRGGEETSLVLQSRMPLLYSCCGSSRSRVSTVFSILDGKLKDFPSEAQHLMTLWYLASPQDFVNQERLLTRQEILAPSVLDAHLHSLLLYLMGSDIAPTSGTMTVKRVNEAGSKCRKLAMMHPMLVTRHLPMLGALLKSCTSSKGGRNIQEAVLVQFFAILEHLQPSVFCSGESNGLNTCLQCYFDFISEHGSSKHENLVVTFGTFLASYLHHSPSDAVKVIQPNIKILKEYYDSCLSGKRTPILALIEAFSGGVSSGRDSSLGAGPSSPQLLVSVQSGSGLSLQQVMPYLKKLSPGGPMGEVLKVLEDLEDTSRHMMDIIRYFVPDLCRLLACQDPLCCKLAHTLLQRHIKYCPSAIDEILPLLENCLISENPNVVASAVDSLVDIIPLCKDEEAVRLMNKMFVLALKGDVSCEKKLLQVIHSQISHLLQ